jgi:hypothetical protein
MCCRRIDDLDFSEFMSKEEQRLSMERERQRQEEEERRIALEKRLAEEVEMEKLQLLREKVRHILSIIGYKYRHRII